MLSSVRGPREFLRVNTAARDEPARNISRLGMPPKKPRASEQKLLRTALAPPRRMRAADEDGEKAGVQRKWRRRMKERTGWDTNQRLAEQWKAVAPDFAYA